MVIRTSKSINEVRARFPEKAGRITPDRHPMTATERVRKRLKSLGQNFVSPAVDYLTSTPKNAIQKVPSVDVFNVYVKDRRLFKGEKPILMGDPETNWSYTVYPVGWRKDDGSIATEEDARLYPRGRLVIATKTVVLFDGPNPYWHGMFPIAKLSLDPWPLSIS